MIMGILLLLVANILIMIGCLIKRKFKASLLLSIPVIIFILVVTWFFTPVPVSLGIVKLPVIEFVKVRNIIENDSLYVDVEHESGVIELLADKRLEKAVNGGLLRLVGMDRPDFSYENTYEDTSSKDIILCSVDILLIIQCYDFRCNIHLMSRSLCHTIKISCPDRFYYQILI